MDRYITAEGIRSLREKNHMTQAELADTIGVSAKAVSKWENARGLPDISLIQPIAEALGVSVIELLSGEYRINDNIACNVKRSKFYVCPICGNIIHATGASMVSCCGVTLPEAEPEPTDEAHTIHTEYVDGCHYVTVDHPMEKTHYISFIAYVTDGHFEMRKLYPEGNAEADFLGRGHGMIYCYCNQHGLMMTRV